MGLSPMLCLFDIISKNHHNWTCWYMLLAALTSRSYYKMINTGGYIMRQFAGLPRMGSDNRLSLHSAKPLGKPMLSYC